LKENGVRVYSLKRNARVEGLGNLSIPSIVSAMDY